MGAARQPSPAPRAGHMYDAGRGEGKGVWWGVAPPPERGELDRWAELIAALADEAENWCRER